MEEKHYIVSARKYRPATFQTVVGQQSLTSTLKNAISSGRLAQAYLFCGPRGVGKTSCARIFAKTINCLHPTAEGEACGECESCRAIDRGTSFNIIELDAASNNSVDDIRNLTEQVNVSPQGGRYRVFIIDEVHMLSTSAFNAFLKTLEEPPKYVVFILATTEKHKVIPTILSRCQIYDFKRITIADMVSHLEHVASSEGVTAELSALNVIARKADGAMRDALSIFDQVSASSRGNITYASTVESLNVLDYDYYFRLVDAFSRRDVQGALLLYKEVRDKGFDSLFFVNGLAAHVRDLMVAYTPQTVPLLEVAGDVAERYLKQARTLSPEWYYEALELLNDCDLNYRVVTDKRLHVELCLVRLCRIGVSHREIPASSAPPTTTPQSAQSTSATRQSGTPASAQATTSAGQPSGASQHGVPAQQRSPERPADVVKSAVKGSGTAVRIPRITTVRSSSPQSAAPAAQSASAASAAPAASVASVASQGQTAPEAGTEHTDDSGSGDGSSAGVSKPPGISAESMARVWEEFAANHPDHQMLASTMRAAELRREPSGQFTVVVPHAGGASVINAELREITDFIRQRLGTDALNLSVEISQQQRTKILSPRESLTKAVRENKILYHLLDSLNVEII